MLSNFIYAKTKDLFIALLEAGNVLDKAIVFIEDTKEIWNHGTYFGGDLITFISTENTSDEIDNVAIKDAKLNGEKIYLKGHAKCTYLSDGRTVESAISDLQFYEGFNAIATVSQIPITKRLVVVKSSQSEALSLKQIPDAGKEIHIIVNNIGTSTTTIALPNTGNYVCLTDTALNIDAGGYAEINIISDGTLIYIRSL